MRLDDREVQQRVARAGTLLEKVEALEDPRARSTAADAVQALLGLYGEGLARMLQRAARLGGEDIVQAVAEDELVSHLLLLHGLHPVDVGTRVRRALEELRPYLQSRGGGAELLTVEDGVARVRVRGGRGGTGSSIGTLESAVEQAVRRAAPDLDGVEVVAETPPVDTSGLVQLVVRRASS